MSSRVERSASAIRKRLEDERSEALDHLEQPEIENPEAAYWGGRYYVAVNMLLWMGPYSGPVFEKSERYDRDAGDEQTECPECGHPKRIVPDPRKGDNEVKCTSCGHLYERYPGETDESQDTETDRSGRAE